MSVRHAAGTVFKAFTAHVTVFFVRMADFALTVLRVTRNVVAVMMFMSAAAAIIMLMVMMFPTTTTFAMLMFVVVLMPTATFSMTIFVVMLFFPTTAAVMMVLMFFTTAGIVFMPFMSMSFAAAARFVMAVLVFRLIVVLMPALGTVFRGIRPTAATLIFMMMVMRTHFITAVSCIS